jgi:hypothetical protein
MCIELLLMKLNCFDLLSILNKAENPRDFSGQLSLQPHAGFEPGFFQPGNA